MEQVVGGYAIMVMAIIDWYNEENNDYKEYKGRC